MRYRIEIIDRRMGDPVIPEYHVRSAQRRYRADNQADAEYLCWALNHLSEAQHMDALVREGRNAA